MKFVICILLLILCRVSGISKLFLRENYWKLFGYDIDGVQYTEDSDYEHKKGSVLFKEELEENEKFLIQKNLVPYGLEHFPGRLVISIPRTRPGIPFSLNTVEISIYADIVTKSPLLKPYPSTKESKEIISVYDLESSICSRVWFIDTGFIDIPGVRKQVQPPKIMAIDIHFTKLLFQFEIDASVLKNTNTAGLTTLVVLETDYRCIESVTYILDDANNAVIAFSLNETRFWRIEGDSSGRFVWNVPVSPRISELFDWGWTYKRYKTDSAEHLVKLLNEPKASAQVLDPQGVIYTTDYYHDILIFTNEMRTKLYCWNTNTTLEKDNGHLVTVISKNNDFYISGMSRAGRGFHLMLNRFRSNESTPYNETEINFAYYTVDVDDMLNNKCTVRKT